MKTAYLFPGQGSQVVGMGKDIYNKYDEAKEIYKKASEITKKDIAKLCFEADEEQLKDTENAQIAILVTSLAALQVIKAHGKKSDISVGISLGEYTALIDGGYLSIEEGIQLIQKRGYYMGNMIPKEDYAMAAVIKLESSKIEEICKKLRQEGKFVVPSNYNYKEQTVISGNSNAIDEAIELIKEAGALKAIKLNTSGPFHTEKLEKAKELYQKDLEKANFMEGTGKVIKNINGEIYTKSDNMVEILSNHIVMPVRFDKAIETMEKEGIDTYVEIGPGKAITGFIKRHNKDAVCYNINNVESLEEYLSI